MEGIPEEPKAYPAREAAETRREGLGDRNIVYIGKKDTMVYVLAVVTQFNQGNTEVHLKARGRSINRAVDTTQIVKNRFIPTMKIKNIDITTEELTSEDGSTSKVSSMEIIVSKE